MADKNNGHRDESLSVPCLSGILRVAPIPLRCLTAQRDTVTQRKKHSKT